MATEFLRRAGTGVDGFFQMLDRVSAYTTINPFAKAKPENKVERKPWHIQNPQSILEILELLGEMQVEGDLHGIAESYQSLQRKLNNFYSESVKSARTMLPGCSEIPTLAGKQFLFETKSFSKGEFEFGVAECLNDLNDGRAIIECSEVKKNTLTGNKWVTRIKVEGDGTSVNKATINRRLYHGSTAEYRLEGVELECEGGKIKSIAIKPAGGEWQPQSLS
jgi:hypothetical protein